LAWRTESFRSIGKLNCLTESNRPTASDLAGEVFSFAAAIRDCESLAACAALFRDAIAQYGFDTFACGEVDTVERNRCVFYVVGWPPAWLDVYVKSGFIEHDPVVERAKRQALPFTWSELLADKTLSMKSRGVLQAAAGFGWTEGLAVPFTRTETRFGLVSAVLGIAQSTAQEHVEAAKRKLNVRNRAEAAAVGVSLGLA